VTPSKVNAVFTPANKTYADITNDQVGQNYQVGLSFTSSISDGLVLESSETSNIGNVTEKNDVALYVGDDISNKQYRSILVFNTSSIPDAAVITAIALKMKQHSMIGNGNPLTTFKGLMTDIKAGFFGTSAALQSADFQTTADKTLGPFNPALINSLYTINLINGKTYINTSSNNSGLTQIRLRFQLDDNNNMMADLLKLYSGNAINIADRPQLVINYYVTSLNPTPRPTFTVSPTTTPTNTSTPTITSTSTYTPTPSLTPTETETPTFTPTETETPTPTETETETPTA
jgi:hypothetical protein